VSGVVELYGHGECSLCRTAREQLVRLQRELGFELVEHDIHASERLLRAYFERVPVVCVDGVELFDLVVDEAALRACLAGAETNRAGLGDDLQSGR
jgi:hypothetical protein